MQNLYSAITFLFPLASALATPALQSRAAACAGNTASTRSEWCNYSINTDYYTEGPTTGVTREYYFNLEQATIAPDGVPRVVTAINGSVPGPTIFANWGDEVVVHFTNSLTTWENGSSIHFHGIRQLNNNQNDGVVSLTQCPVAEGSSYTYRWKATQYGTTWYHSHIGLQAWEGLAGPIVIDGPASANYDVDKGPLLLTDWTHPTVDELYHQELTIGPPTLDNGLINGQNVYNNSGVITGSRYTTSVVAGQSYRFRLINGAIDTHFKFMIDNHTMQVIANDLVPLEPYTTDVLNIAIGQRYDIIVTANQQDVAENFWIRAIPQSTCSSNANADNIRGVLSYSPIAGVPSTKGYAYIDGCVDEPMSDLVPYLPQEASTSYISESESVILGQPDGLFHWFINGSSFQVEWANPTLLQIYNNQTDFTTPQNVIQLPTPNQTYYIVIQNENPIPHPIHLHGHDFFLMAQGVGTYNTSDLVSVANPPRRDVALLLASGYLVLGFRADNPGAWLMHCHIGWHTDEGLDLQIVEEISSIKPLINDSVLQSTCNAWTAYAKAKDVQEQDSGV